MENNIDFSIIVPAYNSSLFIDKCINSVLSQSYDNYELIIVDDGSTDDTLIKCQNYQKENEKIKIMHKTNGGHTSARNVGLELSKGKYIIFLDSDDYLSSKTLEECLKEYKLHYPDIIVFSLKKKGHRDSLPMSVPDGFYKGKKLKKIINKDLICGSNGKYAFSKSLSGKCFKRETIYKYQLTLPNEITIGEDGLVFIESVLNAKSLSVISKKSNVCYIIYERDNSISKTSDKNAIKKCLVLLKCYNNILESYPLLSKQINRNVIMQLYTSMLYVMRSNVSINYLNSEIDRVFSDTQILKQFKKAKFSIAGYKCKIKKLIIFHRLWDYAKRIDNRRF